MNARRKASPKKSEGLNLYGLFGYPVSHSLSPKMHNAGFRYLGIESYYLCFGLPPQEFQSLMKQKKKLPLSGFNLTVPHKRLVLPFLDKMSPEVKGTGACNTVIVKKGVWHGENTDIHGFLKGLELKKFNPKNKDVVLLGAGGAARALSYGLLSKGIRSLIVMNPAFDFEMAQQLIRDFAKLFPQCLYGAACLNDKNLKALLPGKDLIINATILGLKENDPSPVSLQQLPKPEKKVLAYDLIYSPETPFLKVAKKKGYEVQNGAPMLLHQGAKAFELWTEKKAPVAVMKKGMES